MEQNKKKNKRLLILSLFVLLVAVASVFIGSFAGYIMSSTISDNASVAKFGLNIPNTVDLFADSYTNVTADTDGKKIIAPGTDGQYKFVVTGTSEVAYKISAAASLTYSDSWNGYEPLKFSINGTDWTDFDQFQTDLSNALSSAVMAPNTAYESTHTIYWKWPFSVSSAKDIQDTEMGTAAATGTAPTVTLDIEVTAAQVN